MSLEVVVLEVHDALGGDGVAHAFGGALALAYVAEPRGTVDVDVNVFVPVTRIDQVLEVFDAIGLRPERPRSEWPFAGIRLRSEDHLVPVDLFPSLEEVPYAEIERRCVVHPFGPDLQALPFLSAEDLAIFKLSFGRDKDWVDLRHMAAAVSDLDADYIEQQLLALRGPHMHPRVARLRGMLRATDAE